MGGHSQLSFFLNTKGALVSRHTRYPVHPGYRVLLLSSKHERGLRDYGTAPHSSQEHIYKCNGHHQPFPGTAAHNDREIGDTRWDTTVRSTGTGERGKQKKAP